MRDSISATSATIADADDSGMFAWWRAADGRARHAFVAASLGWMLDSFDVMLYSLVLASLIQDPTLQLSTAVAGQLGALTLLSAAVGGVVFGVLADRIGRKQALMAAVLIYSVFTAACGLVQNVAQLAVCRILLGFGMGGEWATGVALVSETFPAKHRGKALAFVQSSWAIGYGLAALVNLLVMPVWGWRGVFFVGVLPALFTLWIRRKVEEPELWRRTPDAPRHVLLARGEPDRAATNSTPNVARYRVICLIRERRASGRQTIRRNRAPWIRLDHNTLIRELIAALRRCTQPL